MSVYEELVCNRLNEITDEYVENKRNLREAATGMQRQLKLKSRRGGYSVREAGRVVSDTGTRSSADEVEQARKELQQGQKKDPLQSKKPGSVQRRAAKREVMRGVGARMSRAARRERERKKTADPRAETVRTGGWEEFHRSEKGPEPKETPKETQKKTGGVRGAIGKVLKRFRGRKGSETASTEYEGPSLREMIEYLAGIR